MEELENANTSQNTGIVNPESTGGSRNPDGTFKAGISGNPAGRPKGSGMTMKEYASRKLKEMSDEEKEAFLKEITKEVVWKMSEGNPKQDTETEHKGAISILGINYVQPGSGNNTETGTEATPGVPSTE